MTAGPDPTPDGRSRLPLVRWGLLAVLLPAEAMALSVGFDAAVRANDPGWAGAVVAWSPAVGRWGLVFAGTAGVLGAWLLGNELRAAARTPYSARCIGLAVLGHLAAYGLLVWCTTRVASRDVTPGGLDVLAWLAAGLLTVGLWALAILPLSGWVRLVRRGGRVIAIAAAVATLAVLASRATRAEWDVLAGPTLYASHALLRVVVPDPVFDPGTRLLGTARFRVEVGVPCSGYEGLGLMAAYLALYLVLFRRDLRFPRAFLLIPLALLAVWAANVVRVAALIVLGDRVSPSLAMGGFHSQAGWLGFNLVALGLLLLAHRGRLFTRQRADAAGPDATAAHLAPLLGGVAVQMLLVALTPDQAALYPLRALLAAMLLWYFWPRYGSLRVPGNVSAGSGIAWALAAGGLVFLLWVALVPPGSGSAPEAAAAATGWVWAAWVIGKVVGYVVVTPLAEELAFRGYLMRRLVSPDFEAVRPGAFTWLSFVVSSVVFGLMHGHWLAGTLAGMAYGLVVVRTGRVRDAVVAHALTNGLLAVRMAVTGTWGE